MAVHEIIKSGRRIHKVTQSKSSGILHKIKEVSIEVVIIVFAVTLSIGLHSRSEERHKQDEVRTFMKGLKTDLENDIIEMESDVSAFKGQKKLFDYLSSLKKGETADKETIGKHRAFLFGVVRFNENSARYEGFKSSGKLGYIKNESLQNNILHLYVDDISSLMSSTVIYNTKKDKFVDFVTDHTSDYPEGNFYEVLSSEPVKNLSIIYLSDIEEIVDEYHACIERMKMIIREIEKEYRL